MANQIQIKRSTNNTIPNSNISGGTLTNGELGYSYSSTDGSGDEAGQGKLYIGHADGLGGTRAAVIIGGSYFTKMLDHSNGTLTASSAILTDNNSHIDALKTTALYIGTSGSATQVTASGAELNKLGGCTSSTAELNILTGAQLDTNELNLLDGVTASTAELNYVDVTAGTLTASKALVADSNSTINTVKTNQLYLSGTLVASTAEELNVLDGITAIESNITNAPVGHTTIASGRAVKDYVDATRSGLEVKDSCKVATTANITLSGTQTIDGIAVSAGDRVLVKDQSTTHQNGIYVCAAGSWSRATDADTATEFNSGVFFFVEQGTVNADSGWVLTTDTAITFGSTAIAFAQFSGAGQIDAGNGLTKTGNTINASVGTGIALVSDEIRIDTAWAGQAAITTVGTIATGTWNATAIGATKGGTGLNTSSSTGVGIVTSGTWTTPAQLTVGYGGTGASTFASNGILYGNGAGTIQATGAGTDGYFLKATGSSTAPAWTYIIDGGTF